MLLVGLVNDLDLAFSPGSSCVLAKLLIKVVVHLILMVNNRAQSTSSKY